MRKIIFFVLFACSLAMAQSSGIVSEAKEKAAKEHHAALVEKAQCLLKEKAELQAKIAAIDANLDRLDHGEDIETDLATTSSTIWAQSSYLVDSMPYAQSPSTACCFPTLH